MPPTHPRSFGTTPIVNRRLLSLLGLGLAIWITVPSIKAGETLTLDEAIARALEENPELLATRLEVQAREARISQAGVLPNPEFFVLSEDIGGSGAYEGFARSQTTAQVSQRVELGGKRGARRDVASSNRDVASGAHDLKRREIVADVRRAFYTVLVAQHRVHLMEELMGVSMQFSRIVQERIQAGKIPPIDDVKATAIVASAEIDLARSQRELDSARYGLAAAIGITGPDFGPAQGELFLGSPEVALQELIDSLSKSPELQKAAAEIDEREALLAIERAKRIPDITLTGGYRTLEPTNDHTFVIGASIPLPLFDRNKGGILEAQRRVLSAEQARNSVEAQIKNSLAGAYQLYSAAKAEAQALQERVLPANQTSFDAISEGYRLGKYGYLDVLEAQRSLFQSRLQLLRVLGDLHAAAAEIERITGKELLTEARHE
ncbi:MAG: TolC family protein [Acidobacteria bacterium]|nr:TolC family protein [Acidobacteriota bacterium]